MLQEHAKNACTKTLSCSHACGGIQNEDPCLPCLHGCQGAESLKQDADDMCMICFTEALAAAPAIQVRSRTVFPFHSVMLHSTYRYIHVFRIQD